MGGSDVIQVINVAGLQGPQREGIVYVGRGFAGWPPSVLGNPYKHGCSRTGSPIEDYRRWLWRHIQAEESLIKDEVIRIAEMARSGERVDIGCWCHPDPCHGDVIKSCIEWMLESAG